MQVRGAGERARSLKVKGEEIWGMITLADLWIAMKTILAYLIWCIAYADIEVLEIIHCQHFLLWAKAI